LALPAHALTTDKGIWDGGAVSVRCGTGTNSRLCHYQFYDIGCTDAAVAGTRVGRCAFTFDATVAIVPILNVAGRIIGCTSDGQDVRTGGSATFDSVVDLFDNPQIDDHFIIQVRDIFADGKPPVGQFTAVEGDSQESTPSWIASGAFAGACAPGAEGGYFGHAGSITVAV
jgi:hypothetical protein